MGLFGVFGKQTLQEKSRQTELCQSYLHQISRAMDQLMVLFGNRNQFIDPDQEEQWRREHADLLSDQTLNRILSLKKAEDFQKLARDYYELTQCAAILQKEIRRHNAELARLRREQAARLIGPVEGHPLDPQQMECIVKDVRNHLVLAGAGTGKTTTIVGKIKYLLASGSCRSRDLLVLSFTNASAAEMRQRIRQETGQEITASTFHRLGLGILQQVEGTAPAITGLNLRQFIREQLEKQRRDSSYLNLLSLYLLYYRVPSRSEFSFPTQKAFDTFRMMYPPKTIRSEVLGSYAEMDIANYLTQHGIAYRHQYAYAFDPHTPDYGTYRPSFYLQKERIYIEYWCVDRSGNVPRYFRGKDGRSAGQIYQASMQWKRNLHRANATKLIECYAYEKAEGTLLKHLEEQLTAFGVTCRPISPKKLWELLSGAKSGAAEGMADLMETVISLLKSNNLTLQEVQKRNQGTPDERVNTMLLALTAPIYEAYCGKLNGAGEIDFNDMINRASRYIREGRWVNPYKQVIVDEYQDISRSRFELLRCMRQSGDFRLFCVGDDWQSIYRFAGSDVGFILNFERFWGSSERSFIETTYRFPQKLIEITGSFIMRNPAQQKKQMRGIAGDGSFPLTELCGHTEQEAVEQLLRQLEKLPRGSSVFLIGRYSFDLNPVREHSGVILRQQRSGLTGIQLEKRPDLTVSFVTAHKSKGLQADYVAILNNRNARMGFPSQVQDAPLLRLLMEDAETFPHAEERRLFYVAMTRARKKVFLLTVAGEESVFVQQLREDWGTQMHPGA